MDIYRQVCHRLIADFDLNLAFHAPASVSRELMTLATVRMNSIRLSERGAFVLNTLAANKVHSANPKLLEIAKRLPAQ